MRPVLTPEEMAAADAAAIAAGTPGVVLMERAGRAVALAAARLAGGRYGRRFEVVCGKGNNGGDGIVAARVLHEQGAAARALLMTDPGSLRGDAATHLQRARAAGLRVAPFSPASLRGADVVVDALFGTGFRGPARGEAAEAIAAVNSCGARVVSVDIPSGVDGTTGAVFGPAVRADVTVTMAALKRGIVVHPGAALAGRVEVADIGVAVEPGEVSVPDPADVASVLPRRPPDAHKRSAGSVVVVGGSTGMSGAALLAARGAQRAGAGYVTLCSTPYVDRAKQVVLPEVVSAVEQREAPGPDALETFAPHLERADAVVLGPGLGRGEAQDGLVAAVLERTPVCVVADADALNSLAALPGPLERRRGPTVITPHPGEMARMLGCSTAEVAADRVGIALGAARRFGCVVVLKGAGTVVAEPEGRALVNPTGGAPLATAGTGDVLSGVVAALAAAGLDPFAAAWAGVYLHGLAGELAGAELGPGTVAWDVAEALPRARAALTGEPPPARPSGIT